MLNVWAYTAKHSVPPKFRAVERFSLKGEFVKGGSTVYVKLGAMCKIELTYVKLGAAYYVIYN